jgi:hypothetical protein
MDEVHCRRVDDLLAIPSRRPDRVRDVIRCRGRLMAEGKPMAADTGHAAAPFAAWIGH